MAWTHKFLLIFCATCADLTRGMECNLYQNKTIMKVAMNNKCYYAWMATGTYKEAISTCSGEDRHVLFTETKEEHHRLVGRLGPDFNKIWIGLEKRDSNWRWYGNGKNHKVDKFMFVDKRVSATGTNAIARVFKNDYIWEIQKPEVKSRIVCEQESPGTSNGFGGQTISPQSSESRPGIKSRVSTFQGSTSSEAQDHGQHMMREATSSGADSERIPALYTEATTTPRDAAIDSRDIGYIKKTMVPGLEHLFQREPAAAVTGFSNQVTHLSPPLNPGLTVMDSEVSDDSWLPGYVAKSVVPSISAPVLMSKLVVGNKTQSPSLIDLPEQTTPVSDNNRRKKQRSNNLDNERVSSEVGGSSSSVRIQSGPSLEFSRDSGVALEGSISSAEIFDTTVTVESPFFSERLPTEPLGSVNTITSNPTMTSYEQQTSVKQKPTREASQNSYLLSSLTNSSLLSTGFVPQEKTRESIPDLDRLHVSVSQTRGVMANKVVGYRVISKHVRGTSSLTSFGLRRDFQLANVTMVMSLSADTLLECARACVSRQTICSATAFKDKTCILYNE